MGSGSIYPDIGYTGRRIGRWFAGLPPAVCAVSYTHLDVYKRQAYNIVNEFREAKDDLDRNIDAKTYWELQLKKYPAAFFYTVMDAINLSSQLASDWLIQYMFSGEEPVAAKKKATKIVKKLSLTLGYMVSEPDT